MSVFDNKEHVQKALLGYMSRGDYYKPGSFFCALLGACMRADSDNMERLRKGFPVVVEAMQAYQRGLNLDDYSIIRDEISK